MVRWAALVAAVMSLLALCGCASSEVARPVVASAPFAKDASAVTYYVSSSTGHDGNNGMSKATAWQSLGRLATVSFASGTSVVLKRGDTWVDETLRLAFLQGPGATLGAFGNTSLPRPRILTSRSATRSWIACAELLDPEHLVVRDIHFAGCSHGLSVRYTSSTTGSEGLVAPLASASAGGVAPNRSGFLVENCFFSDIRYPYGVYNPSMSSWASAVWLTGESVVANVTLRGNVGIRLDTFYQSRGPFVDGLILDGNTVAQVRLLVLLHQLIRLWAGA